jgi:hypothetical protein
VVTASKLNQDLIKTVRAGILPDSMRECPVRHEKMSTRQFRSCGPNGAATPKHKKENNNDRSSRTRRQ